MSTITISFDPHNNPTPNHGSTTIPTLLKNHDIQQHLWESTLSRIHRKRQKCLRLLGKEQLVFKIVEEAILWSLLALIFFYFCIIRKEIWQLPLFVFCLAIARVSSRYILGSLAVTIWAMSVEDRSSTALQTCHVVSFLTLTSVYLLILWEKTQVYKMSVAKRLNNAISAWEDFIEEINKDYRPFGIFVSTPTYEGDLKSCSTTKYDDESMILETIIDSVTFSSESKQKSQEMGERESIIPHEMKDMKGQSNGTVDSTFMEVSIV